MGLCTLDSHRHLEFQCNRITAKITVDRWTSRARQEWIVLERSLRCMAKEVDKWHIKAAKEKIRGEWDFIQLHFTQLNLDASIVLYSLLIIASGVYDFQKFGTVVNDQARCTVAGIMKRITTNDYRIMMPWQS